MQIPRECEDEAPTTHPLSLLFFFVCVPQPPPYPSDFRLGEKHSAETTVNT